MTSRMLLWVMALTLPLVSDPTRAQTSPFQIVWVVVGDAMTGSGDRPSRAGRHLFMAADLANMSLKQVSVNAVRVEPTVSALTVGQRFCLSSLTIAAKGANRSTIKNAPLSVSVRQDQRDALGLESHNQDICVRPSAAGEFPIRFTSLLPASDGTSRVAQVFLRVHEATANDSP